MAGVTNKHVGYVVAAISIIIAWAVYYWANPSNAATGAIMFFSFVGGFSAAYSWYAKEESLTRRGGYMPASAW